MKRKNNENTNKKKDLEVIFRKMFIFNFFYFPEFFEKENLGGKMFYLKWDDCYQFDLMIEG